MSHHLDCALLCEKNASVSHHVSHHLLVPANPLLQRLAGAGRPKAPMDNVDESLSSVGDSLGSIL